MGSGRVTLTALADSHASLLKTLEQWARLSANNGELAEVDKVIRRIVKTSRAAATDADRDLFDHLVRRAEPNERRRLSGVASKARAGLDWLDAIVAIGSEPDWVGS